MWSREHPTMPEGARAWFNLARFVGSVMAVGSMLTGFAGVLFIFIAQSVFSLDDDNNPDEPWSTGDIWLVCIYFTWLFVLPTLLLIAFSHAERKQHYLYGCTLFLSLAAAAQIAFIMYDPRSLLFFIRGASLISSLCLVGWLIALCLTTTFWSKVRLAEGVDS